MLSSMGASEELASFSTSPPACSLQDSTCALPSKANYIHSKDSLEVKSMVTCWTFEIPRTEPVRLQSWDTTQDTCPVCDLLQGQEVRFGSIRSPSLRQTNAKRPPSGGLFAFARRRVGGREAPDGGSTWPARESRSERACLRCGHRSATVPRVHPCTATFGNQPDRRLRSVFSALHQLLDTFISTSPLTISTAAPIRSALTCSPRKMMPTMKAPTAPMPVQMV